MTPLHLGALHPVEQGLTLALAFGPFLVLGAVVWWRHRQDGAAGPDGGDAGPRQSEPGETR